jgi:hypothetical protein
MAPRNRVPKSSWELEDTKKEPPRTCSTAGKRIYDSEHEANSTAAHRMSDKQSAPSQLRQYKCLYCGAWHLTSKEA